MKILCFTSSDRPALYETFWPTFVSYCTKWSIDYKLFPIEPDFPRHQSWMKIKLMIDLLQKNDYDILWWVDDDMIITNDTIDIRSVISSLPDASIIVQKDIGGVYPLNCGTMIVRASALQVLNKVWNSATAREIREPNWEQNTITRMMPECMHLVEWKVLQSFCRQSHYTPEGLQWSPGDFIAHFTGETVETRLELFKKCAL